MATNIDLILEEWVASLKNKDRTASAVEGNFDELFEILKRANVTFDEAHSVLPKAIKAHQPSSALIRSTYKVSKSKLGDKTEKEFAEDWNKSIADKGTNSMFAFFPRPKVLDEEESEPKVYGQMSVKEYRQQRRHADQYPILDTEALERRLQSETYNPMEDIKDILGKKDNNGNNK